MDPESREVSQTIHRSLIQHEYKDTKVRNELARSPTVVVEVLGLVVVRLADRQQLWAVAIYSHGGQLAVPHRKHKPPPVRVTWPQLPCLLVGLGPVTPLPPRMWVLTKLHLTNIAGSVIMIIMSMYCWPQLPPSRTQATWDKCVWAVCGGGGSSEPARYARVSGRPGHPWHQDTGHWGPAPDPDTPWTPHTWSFTRRWGSSVLIMIHDDYHLRDVTTNTFKNLNPKI